MGVMPRLFGSRRTCRTAVPIAVPPGSRVTAAPPPSLSASQRSCVVLPQPSIPSNVMNGTARFYQPASREGRRLDAPARRG